MKIFALILGLVFGVLGLGLTAYGWYVASAQGRIVDGLAYTGPFLLVVGVWRAVSAGMAGVPSLLRIVAVGIGIGAGFGNTAALKAIFPSDQIISTQSTH
jgi:hypothetical protein